MSSRSTSAGLFIARLAVGLPLAVNHGWGKFQSLMAGSEKFPDPLHIGARASLTGSVLGELLCPILMIIGLATRAAAGGVVFTMSVILFVMDWGRSPLKNELAFLFFAMALAVLFCGPGRFSLDALLEPRFRRLTRRGAAGRTDRSSRD